MGEFSDNYAIIAVARAIGSFVIISRDGIKTACYISARKYDVLLRYFAKHRYFSSPLTINGYVKMPADSASLEITSCRLSSRATLLRELLIINLLRERSSLDLRSYIPVSLSLRKKYFNRQRQSTCISLRI